MGVSYPIMYTIPEEQIGPNAASMKLEPTKAPYRVFRLISSTREVPHANLGEVRNAPAAAAALTLCAARGMASPLSAGSLAKDSANAGE